MCYNGRIGEVCFMKYDIDDIALRVEARKRKFTVTVLTCVCLVLLSVFVGFLYPETTVVFICAVVIVISIVYLFRYIKRNNPLIVFSKGFCGENIKEHEYVIGGTRLYRYGGIKYTYHPSRHKGDVYIRRDDGGIVVVPHLPKKHLDIFEIGDTLVCYPGTKYPNVDSRDSAEQPCPICGYVNGEGQELCSSCGLKILQKRR